MQKEKRAALQPIAIALTFATLLGACTNDAERVPRLSVDGELGGPRAHPRYSPDAAAALALGPSAVEPRRTTLVYGREPARSAPNPGTEAAASPPGTYTLNFDNADIHDVAKAVLADMLQIPYAIAPGVSGSISLHTATPLARDAVLPAFEDALQMAGVALVASGGGYQLLPLQGASRAGALTIGAHTAGSGYREDIIPLRYAAAAEIQHLIEPLVAAGTVLQVDPQRNLIIVGGSSGELARLRQTIAMFDVDWLRAQSFALIPLKYSQARSVAADLKDMIGQGPMAGLVRVIPITHLNAILVVSSRAAYVSEMRDWVDRFDHGRDSASPRVYVYRVLHGRAADMAAVLSKALSPRNGNAPPPPEPDQTGGLDQHPTLAAGAPAPNPLLGGLAPTGNAEDFPLGDVRITADETNNALLIVATPDKFRLVEEALQQLDATPLQVLLEACVAEVHLTNQLKYGLQYYFRNGNVSVLQSAVVPASLAADTGGLSVLFSQGNNIQAVLDLLGTVSKVTVISAPRVMVLNNRTASIEVGDQVPIATSTAVGVVTANAPVVNTIQLLDTGIILRVTPRVGSGGLVLLDIDQEVSTSVPTTSSTINSPTIQQRKISSSIAVQDGQTLAIGGLISDTRTKSRSGIPYLMDLPYLGPLFSLRNDQVDRTELIVLIAPRVLHDREDADDATKELEEKLPLLRGVAPAIRPR